METLQPTDEERRLYELLKKEPDFDRFPLPKDWYFKFPIAPPTIPTLQETLQLQAKTKPFSDIAPYEIREPAPGGVRPLIDYKAPELQVFPNKTLKDLDLSGNLVDETPVNQESKFST